MPIVGPGGGGGGGVTRKEVEEIIAEKGGGPPSGKAGGSLTGEYPNPVIAAAAISLSMLTAAAKEVGGSLTGSLPNPGLAANSVTSVQVAAEAIATAALQPEAVTLGKLSSAVQAGLLSYGTAEAQVARLAETEYEPSATRFTIVIAQILSSGTTPSLAVIVGNPAKLAEGGQIVYQAIKTKSAGNATFQIVFAVRPGDKFRFSSVLEVTEMKTSYIHI